MGLLGGDSEFPKADFEIGERVKSGTTKRVVDREAGVVLYAWRDVGAEGVALTAVPIDQTDLQRPGRQQQQPQGQHQGQQPQGQQPQGQSQGQQPQGGQQSQR